MSNTQAQAAVSPLQPYFGKTEVLPTPMNAGNRNHNHTHGNGHEHFQRQQQPMSTSTAPTFPPMKPTSGVKSPSQGGSRPELLSQPQLQSRPETGDRETKVQSPSGQTRHSDHSQRYGQPRSPINSSARSEVLSQQIPQLAHSHPLLPPNSLQAMQTQPYLASLGQRSGNFSASSVRAQPQQPSLLPTTVLNRPPSSFGMQQFPQGTPYAGLPSHYRPHPQYSFPYVSFETNQHVHQIPRQSSLSPTGAMNSVLSVPQYVNNFNPPVGDGYVRKVSSMSPSTGYVGRTELQTEERSVQKKVWRRLRTPSQSQSQPSVGEQAWRCSCPGCQQADGTHCQWSSTQRDPSSEEALLKKSSTQYAAATAAYIAHNSSQAQNNCPEDVPRIRLSKLPVRAQPTPPQTTMSSEASTHPNRATSGTLETNQPPLSAEETKQRSEASAAVSKTAVKKLNEESCSTASTSTCSTGCSFAKAKPSCSTIAEVADSSVSNSGTLKKLEPDRGSSLKKSSAVKTPSQGRTGFKLIRSNGCLVGIQTQEEPDDTRTVLCVLDELVSRIERAEKTGRELQTHQGPGIEENKNKPASEERGKTTEEEISAIVLAFEQYVNDSFMGLVPHSEAGYSGQEARHAQHMVQATLRQLWPFCEVETYGSLSTGLWLPGQSDLDLLINFQRVSVTPLSLLKYFLPVSPPPPPQLPYNLQMPSPETRSQAQAQSGGSMTPRGTSSNSAYKLTQSPDMQSTVSLGSYDVEGVKAAAVSQPPNELRASPAQYALKPPDRGVLEMMFSNSYYNSWSRLMNQLYLLNGDLQYDGFERDELIAILTQVQNVFFAQFWCSNVKMIASSMPVVKLLVHQQRLPRYRGEKASTFTIPVDISILTEEHMGLQARDYICKVVNDCPGVFRPFVLMLKQLLRENQLNDVYTGGLGSYSLSLMVVFFLKRCGFVVEDVDFEIFHKASKRGSMRTVGGEPADGSVMNESKEDVRARSAPNFHQPPNPLPNQFTNYSSWSGELPSIRKISILTSELPTVVQNSERKGTDKELLEAVFKVDIITAPLRKAILETYQVGESVRKMKGLLGSLFLGFVTMFSLPSSGGLNLGEIGISVEKSGSIFRHRKPVGLLVRDPVSRNHVVGEGSFNMYKVQALFSKLKRLLQEHPIHLYKYIRWHPKTYPVEVKETVIGVSACSVPPSPSSSLSISAATSTSATAEETLVGRTMELPEPLSPKTESSEREDLSREREKSENPEQSPQFKDRKEQTANEQQSRKFVVDLAEMDKKLRAVHQYRCIRKKRNYDKFMRDCEIRKRILAEKYYFTKAALESSQKKLSTKQVTESELDAVSLGCEKGSIEDIAVVKEQPLGRNELQLSASKHSKSLSPKNGSRYQVGTSGFRLRSGIPRYITTEFVSQSVKAGVEKRMNPPMKAIEESDESEKSEVVGEVADSVLLPEIFELPEDQKDGMPETCELEGDSSTNAEGDLEEISPSVSQVGSMSSLEILKTNEEQQPVLGSAEKQIVSEDPWEEVEGEDVKKGAGESSVEDIIKPLESSEMSAPKSETAVEHITSWAKVVKNPSTIENRSPKVKAPTNAASALNNPPSGSLASLSPASSQQNVLSTSTAKKPTVLKKASLVSAGGMLPGVTGHHQKRRKPKDHENKLDQKPSACLFVGNLSYYASLTDIESLKEQFSHFGKITKFSLNKQKGVLWIKYENVQTAIKALKSMDQKKYLNRPLYVDFSQMPTYGYGTHVEHMKHSYGHRPKRRSFHTK